MNRPPTDFDPTLTGPWRAPSVPTNSDFVRLETRLCSRMDRSDERVDAHFKEFADVLKQLILLTEQLSYHRQMQERQEQRLIALELKAGGTEAKLNQWISYGVGAWAIASTIFAAWVKLK